MKQVNRVFMSEYFVSARLFFFKKIKLLSVTYLGPYQISVAEFFSEIIASDF